MSKHDVLKCQRISKHDAFMKFVGQRLCWLFQTDLGGQLILVNAIEEDRRINCTWKIELTNTDKVVDLYLFILDIPKTDDCASNYVKVVYMCEYKPFPVIRFRKHLNVIVMEVMGATIASFFSEVFAKTK